jgi:DNA-binding transcriptional LysR family regulator
MADLDWNDVRFFLAIARAKTLARAAAALHVDQTTVGRRLASLEAKLGVALFTRAPGGFTVTTPGRGILESAERMEEAALELRARAGAGDAKTAGTTVKVATTESLAEHFLVPALGALDRKRITVVLHTSWLRVDLRKGEADLAVRLVRPSDPRLACRKLADFALRLYASREYVEARGMPESLAGHSLISYEEAVKIEGRHPFADLAFEDAELTLLSNDHHVLLKGATEGLGIVQMPSYVGDVHPDLVRVMPHAEIPYGVWLVVPQANRRLAAIRAVSDAIAGAFRRTPASRPSSRLPSPTPRPPARTSGRAASRG